MRNLLTYTLATGVLCIATASTPSEPNNNKVDNVPLIAHGIADYAIIEVTGMSDTINHVFVQDKRIYKEGIDTLAQPKFWQTVMQLPKDSAILNIGSTRQILEITAVKDWNKNSDNEKTAYRDSIKKHYSLPEDEHIYLTSGKKHFYDFEKVMPSISRAVEVFEDNDTDPFYAQAILLIESPGKLEKSPVGAYGAFQIMSKVAVLMGLKVNSYVDERKDFDKSAWAAAKLLRTICIPETNRMLKAKNITYDTNDLWYKLLVLHSYHAGAGNVKVALEHINPTEGGMQLIQQLWQTEVGHFRNASQNYSQLALASMLTMNKIIAQKCTAIYPCHSEIIVASERSVTSDDTP